MTSKPVTGIKINADGKIKVVPRYRDASHAIASKKSQKKKVVKRMPGR